MATCVVRNDVAMSTKSFSVSVARRPSHLTTILTGFSALRLMSAIANCAWVCVGRRACCSSTRPAPICCVTLRMRVGALTEFLVQYERSRERHMACLCGHKGAQTSSCPSQSRSRSFETCLRVGRVSGSGEGFEIPNRSPDPLVRRAARYHPFPISAGSPWRERDVCVCV